VTDGTPADLTRVVLIPQRGSHVKAFMKAMKMLDSDGLRKQGYLWFCVSAPADDPDHAYLEAWHVKPEKQAPLNRAAAVPVTNSFGTPQGPKL
jgi:hypothetical protein